MSDALRFVDITEDQLDAVMRVRARSFGVMAAGDREQWLKDARVFIQDGRYVGVADGDEVVAAARFWDFEQWWSGRPVRMAGVAGVVVAPEYRGRGVGSKLMRGVLQRAVDKGFPLTGLYPATTVIYRHLGYEFGGGRYRFSFPAADLRSLGGKEVAVRRAGPDDAERFLELAGQSHTRRRTSGPLVWPIKEVKEWLADEENFAYLAEDGFVVYNWSGSDLCVDELVAGSDATARALWATVGSGSSIASTVQAYISPDDPLHLLVEHEAYKDVQHQRWMLRLLDAPAAIAARGFAPDVAVEADLRIDDPDVPANTGDWHLSVADGVGRLTPTEASGDVLQLGPRGLAALYAGTPVATLQGAGLVSGRPAAELDTVFASATPYMLDYF
ncbi:enhanced intracellular survival protein Eis [Kribbella sp. NPDC050124]|uniref:enhanced intracellular survival protein Eis n=1 Tax=Kribbella sp. NPDC050124 TaxID=3364114 RepID=UPI0037A8D18C